MQVMLFASLSALGMMLLSVWLGLLFKLLLSIKVRARIQRVEAAYKEAAAARREARRQRQGQQQPRRDAAQVGAGWQGWAHTGGRGAMVRALPTAFLLVQVQGHLSRPIGAPTDGGR